MLNRMSGLFFALVGVLLLAWLTPNHTEITDFGWLKPATLPNILSVIMIIGGLLQTFLPTGKAELDGALTLRAAIFLALCLAALLLMKYLGFLIVAPTLAFVVMMIIGERRPLWMFIGILLVPTSLWAIVVHVLERSLP